MIKFMGFLLLLAGGAVGGKFYTEYKIETELDEAVSYLSNYIDISYGDAVVNYDGSFSLTDLRYSELDSRDEVRVDEIKLYSSNNWLFLTEFYKSNQEKMMAWFEEAPEQLSLSVNNFSFVPDQKYFSKSTAMITGCANINEKESMALQDQGFERLDVSFSLDFDLSNKAESQVNFYAQVKNILEFDAYMEMDYSNFNPLSREEGQVPEPKAITMGISQDEYFSKLNVEYCAKKLELSEEQYLTTIVGDPGYLKGSGLVPDEKMMEAVQSLAQGSRLEIQLQPSIAFSNFDQLKFFKPQDAIQMMGLSMSVDGEPLNDLIIDTEADGFQIATASWDNKKPNAKSEASEVKLAKSGYHEVSINDLNSYIGTKVKVTRKTAEPMVGKLLSYGAGTVKIQQRRYGGMVTFPIASKDIQSMQVYF